MDTGRWHKKFFTNGDVADLLTTMDVLDIDVPRDLFYTIITSIGATTMKSYRLYKKALLVQSQLKRTTSSTRSQRRPLCSTSTSTGNEDHHREYKPTLCITLCFIITFARVVSQQIVQGAGAKKTYTTFRHPNDKDFRGQGLK